MKVRDVERDAKTGPASALSFENRKGVRKHEVRSAWPPYGTKLLPRRLRLLRRQLPRLSRCDLFLAQLLRFSLAAAACEFSAPAVQLHEYLRALRDAGFEHPIDRALVARLLKGTTPTSDRQLVPIAIVGYRDCLRNPPLQRRSLLGALVSRFVLPRGVLDHEVYEVWSQPGTGKRKHAVVQAVSAMLKETKLGIESSALAEDRDWISAAPLRPSSKRER